jgi:hypothetical protein
MKVCTKASSRENYILKDINPKRAGSSVKSAGQVQSVVHKGKNKIKANRRKDLNNRVNQ